jgi:hypothetical protein
MDADKVVFSNERPKLRDAFFKNIDFSVSQIQST